MVLPVHVHFVPFVADYSFCIEWSWDPCSKSVGHRCMGLFLDSFPLVRMSLLMPVSQCFHYCKLCSKIWSWQVWSFSFVLLFQYCLPTWDTLQFCVSLRISFLLLQKNGRWNFDRICMWAVKFHTIGMW